MKPNVKPRRPRRLPEIFTDQEAELLLAQCPATSPSKIRNRAILTVMLNAGLRASEIINLRVMDIEFASGRLWVRQGKGKKDRGLWLNNEDLLLVKKWLEVKPTASSNLLFTSLNGQKAICSRWLRAMVKRVAQQAGIEKDIHCHTLRHSFASKLLRHTKNLFLVSRALGHANLSSTQIYLHLQDYELEEALRSMRNGNP
jgi:site-specific recombinase XerD